MWLKNYLDWFDLALYQYIAAHLDGLKVRCFPHALAVQDQESYKQQEWVIHFVPLPKMHKVVSTKDNFGVTMVDGSFLP